MGVKLLVCNYFGGSRDFTPFSSNYCITANNDTRTRNGIQCIANDALLVGVPFKYVRRKSIAGDAETPNPSIVPPHCSVVRLIFSKWSLVEGVTCEQDNEDRGNNKEVRFGQYCIL